MTNTRAYPETLSVLARMLSHVLTLTDEQLDWLEKRVPDAPVSPLGGRPPTDNRQALRGIFWILDNGAKWKDLPREFGSKSAVHRWFTEWVNGGGQTPAGCL